MKPITLKSAGLLAASLLAGVALAADTPQVAPSELCLKLGTEVAAAAKANPSGVLALVSSKVAASPECACEIVKNAIRGAKADESTTGQIVEAAVRVAPKHYKVIVECAVAANPDAAGHIRAALQNVFGAKGGKGGKVVVVEPPPGMNPALKMAFILDGIAPGTIGQTPGLVSGTASNAAIGGGTGETSVFGFPSAIPEVEAEVPPVQKEKEKERPKPHRPPPATPTNPVEIIVENPS